MQLRYRVANAAIQHFPFPHIYVEDVFPADFYHRMRENLPPRSACSTLTALNRVSDGYPDTRLVLPLDSRHVSALQEPARSFWQEAASWLNGGEFGALMLGKFQPCLEQRFGRSTDQEFTNEALVVQDYTTYRLPPHTDTPSKVLSMLFYLPQDDSMSHLGTSIYLPKDRQQTSDGTSRLPPDQFDRLITMPYKANTLFAFFNTPNAFHGVEPIDERDVRRDLLLYDIKSCAKPEARVAPPASAAAGVRFTF